jgi:hypothetical protein
MSADLSGGVSFESSNCREAANDDDSPSRKLVTLINVFTVGRPNQQQLMRQSCYPIFVARDAIQEGFGVS